MKLFVISDNTDTVMGLRLARIEGVVLHQKAEVLEMLNNCIANPDIGIVLCTTKIMQLCPEVIANYKLKLQKPLICEISDRHGSAKIGETIDSYISQAVGIKI